MKSQAPSLAASTAESSVPNPVTKITGHCARKSRNRSNPDWLASRFMSLTTRSIFSFSARLKACVGLSAVSTYQPSAQNISRSSSHESRSSSTTRMCFIESTTHFMQLGFITLAHSRHVVRDRGECQPEASAYPQLTFNFDTTAVLRNDLTHDHQTKSRAVSAIFRRVEGIKDVTHHLRRHSHSGIDEINRDALRFAGFALAQRVQLNLATIRHCIKTVVDEIQKLLLQMI